MVWRFEKDWSDVIRSYFFECRKSTRFSALLNDCDLRNQSYQYENRWFAWPPLTSVNLSLIWGGRFGYFLYFAILQLLRYNLIKRNIWGKKFIFNIREWDQDIYTIYKYTMSWSWSLSVLKRIWFVAKQGDDGSSWLRPHLYSVSQSARQIVLHWLSCLWGVMWTNHKRGCV